MPSGWFPDPHGRHEHRWFNGDAWTADVADDGRRSVDPAGAGPARQWSASSRQGNGAAAAALVLGVIAVVIAWVPLLVVVGVVLAVLALVFGGRGLRRSRETGSGRGLAIAGLVCGGTALALAVVGVILTVSVVREVRAFLDPAEHEAEVRSCRISDGRIVVEASLTNLSGSPSDFTVYAVFLEPDGIGDVQQEILDVQPGETRTVGLERTVAAVGECRARLVVHGPLPYGQSMERVND